MIVIANVTIVGLGVQSLKFDSLQVILFCQCNVLTTISCAGQGVVQKM